LKRGEKLEKIFSHACRRASRTPSNVVPQSKRNNREKVIDDEAIKALTAKAAKPLFM